MDVHVEIGTIEDLSNLFSRALSSASSNQRPKGVQYSNPILWTHPAKVQYLAVYISFY